MRFFSYDPGGGDFRLHETAEEAQAAAELALDQERELSADSPGWSEGAGQICWGEVLGAAAEVRVELSEGVVVDYELRCLVRSPHGAGDRPEEGGGAPV